MYEVDSFGWVLIMILAVFSVIYIAITLGWSGRKVGIFMRNKEGFTSRNFKSVPQDRVIPPSLPKKIFTYWNEKEITNPVIKANLEYTKSILPTDFELIVLNDESVVEELGKDIKYRDHDMSTPQNFSDFLRFYLLKKYGGIWMDASYIIIDFEKDILSKYREYEADPFDIGLYEFNKYSFGEKPEEKHYESWFLVAPQGSAFVKDVYNEFVKASTIGYREYKLGLRREPGLDLRNTIEAEGEYYFMVYAIMRNVLHRSSYKLKLYSLDSVNLGSPGVSRLIAGGVIYDRWHNEELVAKLTDPEILQKFTSIKLIYNQREAIAKSGKTEYIFHLLKNLH
jgi:hypothetical protein